MVHRCLFSSLGGYITKIVLYPRYDCCFYFISGFLKGFWVFFLGFVCVCREVALEILSQQDIGSFLVRDSTTHPGCYALSVKVPKYDNPSGISHYLITRTPQSTVRFKVVFHSAWRSVCSRDALDFGSGRSFIRPLEPNPAISSQITTLLIFSVDPQVSWKKKVEVCYIVLRFEYRAFGLVLLLCLYYGFSYSNWIGERGNKDRI